MWMDLDFSDQVIEVKRAYVWAQFKVPKSKASKAPVPMHPVLAGFLMAWTIPRISWILSPKSHGSREF